MPLLALTHVRVTLLPDSDVEERGLVEQSCKAKNGMMSPEREQERSSEAQIIKFECNWPRKKAQRGYNVVVLQ